MLPLTSPTPTPPSQCFGLDYLDKPTLKINFAKEIAFYLCKTLLLGSELQKGWYSVLFIFTSSVTASVSGIFAEPVAYHRWSLC